MFNLSAVASLLLLAVAVTLWVRGHWVFDQFSYSRPSWSLLVQSAGGQFRFEHARATAAAEFGRYSGFSHSTDKADGPLRLTERMPGSVSHIDRCGFWVVTGERWGDDHYAAFLPSWFIALATAFLPALWIAAHPCLRRKPILGHCPVCNYDLRATPDRCPECGHVTTEPPSHKEKSLVTKPAWPELVEGNDESNPNDQ